MDIKTAPSGLIVQPLTKKRTSNVLWIKLNFTVKAARLQTLKRQKYQHLQEEALLKARGLLNNWENGEVVLTEDLYRRAAGERDAQELMNYTPEALALRFSLRNDPALLDAVKELWLVDMPRDSLGCIDQKAYASFFRRIAKTIDSDHFHNKRQHRGVNKAIEDDWKRDAKGESVMSFANFFDSTFELADLWCETIDVDEYVDFLQRIRRRISVARNGKRVLRPIKQVRPIDDDDSSCSESSSSESEEEEAPKQPAKVVQTIQTNAIVNRLVSAKTVGPTRTTPTPPQALRKTNSSTATAATALKVASGLRAFSARATSRTRPQTPQTPHSCSHDTTALTTESIPIAAPVPQQYPPLGRRERRPSVFGTLQFGEGGRLTIISGTNADHPDATLLGLASFRPSSSSAGHRREAPMMHGITTEVTDRFLTPRERKMDSTREEEDADHDLELLSPKSQEPVERSDQDSGTSKEWNDGPASVDSSTLLSRPSRIYTVSTAVQKTPAAAQGGFASATRSAMAVMRMAASSIARSSAIPNCVDVGPGSATDAEYVSQSSSAHAFQRQELLHQSGHFVRNDRETIYEEAPLELAAVSSLNQAMAMDHVSDSTPVQSLQTPQLNPVESHESLYADEINASPRYFVETMARATPKSLGMTFLSSYHSPQMRQIAATVQEFTSPPLPQSTTAGLSSDKKMTTPPSSSAAFSTHIKMKTQANAASPSAQKKRMLPPISPILTSPGFDPTTTTLDRHIEELMIGSPNSEATAPSRPNAVFRGQEAQSSQYRSSDAALESTSVVAPLWFALPSREPLGKDSVRSIPGRMQSVIARRARTPTKQQTQRVPQQLSTRETDPMASPWDSFESDDERYHNHGLALKENAYDALAKVHDHETRRSTMAVVPETTQRGDHSQRLSLSIARSPHKTTLTHLQTYHTQTDTLVPGVKGQTKLSGAQSTSVLPSMKDNFVWDDAQLIEIKTRQDRIPQADRSQTASSPTLGQKQRVGIWKDSREDNGNYSLPTWELDGSQLQPNSSSRKPLTTTSIPSPDHHTGYLGTGERSELAMRQRVQTAPSSPLFRTDANATVNGELGHKDRVYDFTMLVNTTHEIVLQPRRMEEDVMASACKELPTRSEMMRRRHKYAFGKAAASKVPKG